MVKALRGEGTLSGTNATVSPQQIEDVSAWQDQFKPELSTKHILSSDVLSQANQWLNKIWLLLFGPPGDKGR